MDVLLVISDPEEATGLSHLLQEADCTAHTVGSPAELKKRISEKAVMAIMIDLDSVAIDNRSIREIASAFPTIPLLCLSKERFHPELKDSILDYIYACLTKPIDLDELRYWLKCIRKDEFDLTLG
jgi:DNA-binding NtrC family response regulator